MNSLKALMCAVAVTVSFAGAAGAADHVTSRILAELKEEVIRHASEVPPRTLVAWEADRGRAWAHPCFGRMALLRPDVR